MWRRAIALSLFTSLALLAACGGAASNEVSIKSPGSDTPAEMPVKSGYVYTSTMTFTEPDGSGGTKMAKCPSHTIYLANHDLDPERGAISLGQEVKAADQEKVVISILGEENGDSKAPVETGTYSATSDRFMKVQWVDVRDFADGKEKKVNLEGKELKGEVKITSSSEDSVSGEIDVTKGDHHIKGSFTAKMHGAAAKEK